MNTDMRSAQPGIRNISAEELIPYYEKVHGAVELISELHAVPAPTPFEYGGAVTCSVASKRIQLLTGLRIDTFAPNARSGAAPSRLLSKAKSPDIIDPVTSMSFFRKNKRS